MLHAAFVTARGKARAARHLDTSCPASDTSQGAVHTLQVWWLPSGHAAVGRALVRAALRARPLDVD